MTNQQLLDDLEAKSRALLTASATLDAATLALSTAKDDVHVAYQALVNSLSTLPGAV